jgi:hypothetical protein
MYCWKGLVNTFVAIYYMSQKIQSCSLQTKSKNKCSCFRIVSYQWCQRGVSPPWLPPCLMYDNIRVSFIQFITTSIVVIWLHFPMTWICNKGLSISWIIFMYVVEAFLTWNSKYYHKYTSPFFSLPLVPMHFFSLRKLHIQREIYFTMTHTCPLRLQYIVHPLR